MCGIHLVAWRDPSCETCRTLLGGGSGDNHNDDHNVMNKVGDNRMSHQHDNLQRRGPDACQRVVLESSSSSYEIRLQASVLQMRHELHPQPVAFAPGWNRREEIITSTDDDDDAMDTTTTTAGYLCWNGEVYQRIVHGDDGCDVLEPPTDPPPLCSQDVWKYESSDTALVAGMLEEKNHASDATAQHCIATVMARLYNAEFAFLIWTNEGLYFGRDPWGRRSLLFWRCEACGSFQIVSVDESSLQGPGDVAVENTTLEQATNVEWTELPPGQVHFIPLVQDLLDSGSPLMSSIEIPTLTVPRMQVKVPTTSIGNSDPMWTASLELEQLLRCAVSMRLDHSSAQSTGVLFSGGVDSAVLAALAADILYMQARGNDIHLPPVLHLYNVSFGPNPEKSADRVAAWKCYEALKERYIDSSHTTIDIIFHDIVVEWDNICQVEQHVRTLLLPKSTVMDVNIATALWFASHGHTQHLGQLHGDNPQHLQNDETSTFDRHNNDSDDIRNCPRVLLLGMGADEQLGGYGRHRKAYDRGGWNKLQEEMQMDQDRLWERNLGRDDRLVSDNGKEARFPFLDAHVVDFLQRTPLSSVCDFGLPPGQGDKRILRLVAQRLGMEYASGLVKRAIQFGSRISHLSDTKRFGSRRKAKGETRI
jgi:asparagine synthetase B (glutamine-hydrolysing)